MSAAGDGAAKREEGLDGSGRATLVVVEFVVLLAFWIVLSWRFDPLFLGMGVVSAALVTAVTHELLADSLGPSARGAGGLPVRAWRFAGFGLWVLTRIPWAGLQIAYYVLHPRMPVEPCVLRFDTHLDSQVARTMLANTITLIPGTLTVAVDDGVFTVHALRPEFADDLVSAEIQNRIGRVFLQAPTDPPAVEWERRAATAREEER